MRILIGCEESQVVTEQFTLKGHDVTSCDFYEASKGYPHYKGDVLDIINDGWDMAIFFPPCTYLAKAQLFQCNSDEERAKLRDEAVEFVKTLYFSDIPRVAVENPSGHLTKAWRHPDQIISPHEFGDPYRKDVCLWLRGLMPLRSWDDQGTTRGFPEDKLRTVKNHVNSRMTNEEKSKIKSSWKWFPMTAKAMADQWG